MLHQQIATSDTDLPRQVRHVLADYLDGRLAESKDLDPAFGEAAQELAKFALDGGKRARPTFAWWGWRAAGGAETGSEAQAMLRAATALELIQACALAHDDLIDNSDTRRGAPALHCGFAKAHLRQGFAGSGDKFGMAVAILLGDLALVWADDMVHESGLGPDALTRAMRPWRAMRTEVLAGQYLDVLGLAREDESTGAALRIDELKAASYTVLRPVQFGAEIAGADQATLDALSRFGSDIGVAFQLRDDLLGVFGDPLVTGKPAGDDLREGKRTLLVAEALERAGKQHDPNSADLIRSVLADPEPTARSIEQVCDALVQLGAVHAIEARIEELTTTAKQALDTTYVAEPAAAKLAELAMAATNRTH